MLMVPECCNVEAQMLDAAKREPHKHMWITTTFTSTVSPGVTHCLILGFSMQQRHGVV
jgi:hypothetical protein